MVVCQKCFIALAEAFRNPPFSLLSFGKFLNRLQKNFTGLPLLLLFLLRKPRTSTGTGESRHEQVAADQQAWDFSCSKRRTNVGREAKFTLLLQEKLTTLEIN